MRVLHLVQAYYPAIGGSEWLTKNLSEHLVSRHGDDVTVFTSNAYKPEAFWRTRGPLMAPGMETINGVSVRRFPIFNGLRLLRSLLARGSHRLRLPYNDWLRTIQTGPLVPGMPRARGWSAASEGPVCREQQAASQSFRPRRRRKKNRKRKRKIPTCVPTSIPESQHP